MNSSQFTLNGKLTGYFQNFLLAFVLACLLQQILQGCGQFRCLGRVAVPNSDLLLNSYYKKGEGGYIGCSSCNQNSSHNWPSFMDTKPSYLP